MKKPISAYRRLGHKLIAYRRRRLAAEAATGLLNTASVALLAALILALLRSEASSPAARWACSLIFFFHVVAAAVMFLRMPAARLFTRKSAALIASAREIGDFFRSINDRVVNALQIYENMERDRERYSEVLMEAALIEAAGEIDQVDLRQAVPSTPLRRAAKRAAATAALLLITTALQRPPLASLTSLLMPWADRSGSEKLQFVVRPGNCSILKGRAVELRAWVSDSSVSALGLHLERRGKVEVVTVEKAADDSFRYRLPSLRDSLTYAFTLDKRRRSPYYTIAVTDPPFLRRLKVQVQPPIYVGQSAYFLEDDIGDVSALKGSLIEVNGTANIEPVHGSLVFSDSSQIPLTVNGRKLSAPFRLRESGFYYFSFFDSYGNANDSPIRYRLSVVPDSRPLVRIVRPGKDIDLGDDMTVPLVIEAQDDYGISKLRLGYQVLTSREGEIDSTRFVYKTILGFQESSADVRLALAWEVGDMELYPTDVLLYFVEAYDNDTVSGPKKSRSAMYRARFPSLYEMYEEITRRQDESSEMLEEMREKSRQVRQKAEQLALKMQREKLDWQKKNELENVLSRQEEINQQLGDAAQKMEEMLQSIEQNKLFSPETLQKFEEIHRLYQEIMTPELMEALKKLDEALQNVDEDQVRRALEELKLNWQNYEQALDRTISLLKELKAEQKLDQAQRLAQDLADRQQKITENAQNPNADAARLRREQEQINADASELEKLMQEAAAELREQSFLPPQLETAQQIMRDEQLSANLQDLEALLRQREVSSVPQKSARAANTMKKTAAALKSAADMMSGEMQRRAFEAMRKSSRDLLALSQQQEELSSSTQTLSPGSADYPAIAEKQHQIRAGLQRTLTAMNELMKESFGVPSNIAASIGRAMTEMDQSLVDLEAREARSAVRSQRRSLAALNEAVRRMQQAMQAMMQQGDSGGMSYQQFLQQMQQLGDSQQRINQQTQQLSSGGLSLSQQAAMSRLAAEQQQLRKSMEALARETEGYPEILGSLDKIAEEMKKVEEDLNRGQITRETINRQNRILSRMLDAQRSIHQREFSRERQAETGKQYAAPDPRLLPEDFGERSDQLQQALLRARKEGYTRDYLQIIENYFKALMRHEADNR